MYHLLTTAETWKTKGKQKKKKIKLFLKIDVWFLVLIITRVSGTSRYSINI